MIINGNVYKIDRQTAIVSKWDKIYCELLQKILDEGEIFENRTGINTLSIEGAYFKLNVGEQFPILESKKIAIKNALSEMLWIYQAQSNNVAWLNDRGNKIWDEWKIDDDGIYRTYFPTGQCEYDPNRKVDIVDINGNTLYDERNPLKAESKIEGKTIKSAKYFGKQYAGTIGTAYGWINNKFKRPQYVLEQLKNNPNDRRMVISLWQDEYLKTAVLPSCVWSSEWKVYNGTLNCFVHQRSADVPLGLPFNVTQYAVLLSLFAKVSNLKPGRMAWSIADAHIYVNQLDGIKLQLRRYKLMLKYEKLIKENDDEVLQFLYDKISNTIDELEKNNLSDNKKYDELKEEKMIFELMVTKDKPMLWLADKEDFFDFDNQKDNKDIKILNYKSAPFIKMPVAQ